MSRIFYFCIFKKNACGTWPRPQAINFWWPRSEQLTFDILGDMRPKFSFFVLIEKIASLEMHILAGNQTRKMPKNKFTTTTLWLIFLKIGNTHCQHFYTCINPFLPTGFWWIFTSKAYCISSNDPIITSLIPKWRSMSFLSFDIKLIKIGWLHWSAHHQMHQKPWVPYGPYGQMFMGKNWPFLLFELILYIFRSR